MKEKEKLFGCFAILRGHNVIRLGVRGRVGVRITTSDPHIGDFPSTD